MPEPFIEPLTPDDTRYEYVPNSWVLHMPDVVLHVTTQDAKALADWFMEVGCDIGVYLYEEMGIEP